MNAVKGTEWVGGWIWEFLRLCWGAEETLDRRQTVLFFVSPQLFLFQGETKEERSVVRKDGWLRRFFYRLDL